jgi:16S rRNA (cytosine967-C5)-methyltransferase
MILHRILAEAAVEVADGVFARRKVLDHELGAAFARHPKWGKRDRAFVAGTVFEVVRWRRALAFVADVAEGDTAALCAAQWRRMGFELPSWWRHEGAGDAEMAERETTLAGQGRAVRESIPDWLDEWGATGLGARWEAELTALNRRARVYLRVNTLRNSPSEARAWLSGHGIEATPVTGMPEALELPEGRVIPKGLLLEGRVEIQDAGSQRIAPLLGARPGEIVVDACAGAGGKTLHLAALMANRGLIHALDVDPRRLRELQRRSAAAGVTNLRVAPMNPVTLAALAGQADRVLVDAPCSGLGTLKRQPDLKWRLTPSDIERVRRIQDELLDSCPAMLRPGGVMVYATCSILPEENHRAVERVTAGSGLSWIEEEQISPAETGWDGFYAAVLRSGTESQ